MTHLHERHVDTLHASSATSSPTHGSHSSAPPPDDTSRRAPGDAAPRTPRPRGFAAMDRKLVIEIASKGGKAAHKAGTAHEFSADEARAAGRKGGLAPHAKRRSRSNPPPQNEVEGEGSPSVAKTKAEDGRETAETEATG